MTKNICNNCEYYNSIYKNYINNQKLIISNIELFKFSNIKIKIQKYIINNWDEIDKHIDIFNSIITELDKNKNLKLSYIGDFIKIYKKYKKYMKNNKKMYNTILKLIDRENFYNEFKQFLYIMSDNERCNLLVYDRKRHNNITKKFLKKIVISCKDNLNIMSSFLVRDMIKLNWGKKYINLHKTIHLLILINNKYKNPLKIYNVEYNIKNNLKITKKNINTNQNLINSIIIDYISKYKKGYNIQDYDNITNLLLYFKNQITIWEAIDLIFDNIFNCNLKHIEESNIINNKNIEYQRNNNKTAFKIFILIKYKCINNLNIFQNFK